MVRTVAAGLRVPERPGQPLIETLASVLETEHVRLVLDNCEHLVAACAQLVERLLRGCPHVQILAASREALGVDGELVFHVPPLGLPTQDAPTLDQLRQSEAVALFVERARSVQPVFELSNPVACTVATWPSCREDQASGVPLIEESLALANSLGDVCTQCNAYHSLGLAAQYRLEYPAAEVMHTTSLHLARRINDTRREYVALHNLAVVAQKQNQFEQATALHEASLFLKREAGDRWSIGYSLFNLGLLAWIGGEPDRASAFVCASLDLRHQLGDKPGLAACLEALAEFDAHQRRWLRAARLFGTTDALLQATGVQIFTPRECGLSRDLEAVRAQLGAATFTRAYSGGRATPLTQVVAEMLGTQSINGVASERRSAHGLTPREQQVAALVADGLSNRQIAARLAIAEGTAQRHVANIMAKLGSISRAEVAAWNARQSANPGPIQALRLG
jgi:DNA-binding CsgD family transcriptional regulator